MSNTAPAAKPRPSAKRSAKSDDPGAVRFRSRRSSTGGARYIKSAKRCVADSGGLDHGIKPHRHPIQHTQAFGSLPAGRGRKRSHRGEIPRGNFPAQSGQNISIYGNIVLPEVRNAEDFGAAMRRYLQGEIAMMEGMA